VEVGSGVSGFKKGDCVISNGPHAEMVCVPKNLCAKVPDGVTDEEAAFTVLSSIALQGVRLASPTLGEKVVVYGLGLIGIIAVQLLRANGCEVLGVDINAERLAFAEKFGAAVCNGGTADPIAAAGAWTDGKGVDAVIITASARTDAIVHQAAEMCRKRGRIVLVGVVGLNLNRNDFYKKELSFQVSCSYGPGRYDEKYELAGHDYPAGFVRWTEQRNFEAILSLLKTGRLDVKSLITDHFAINDAASAYNRISTNPHTLGVVLKYVEQVDASQVLTVNRFSVTSAGKATVGVIGAGNYSRATMLPILSKTDARIAYIADLDGVPATHLAEKYGVEKAVTDYKVILDDSHIDGVMIAVGHNLHAKFVCEALSAGKHAFVEKPLAMNVDEINRILETMKANPGLQVMVGFNRRFSPHTQKIREKFMGRSEPLAMNMTVNAGIVPPDVWVHDPIRGGGRIIGEGCHFIDLLAYIAGSKVKTVAAVQMSRGVAVKEDKMSIVLGFEDGSVGTVNYFANGDKSYPKEMLEVFCEGKVMRLDNFRETVGYGIRGRRKFRTFRQDKGHAAEYAAFISRIRDGGPEVIPMDEQINITLASFAAMTSAAQNRMIDINAEYGDKIKF
ncbi:MAG TPA: bi-domain-containing oxidoreductase, partial [Phycisphaerae bacterium]|nr:bi-domain-containing oxidoreductase [Phycisphaerae bacterium]